MTSRHPANAVQDGSQDLEDDEIIRRVLGGEVNAFELLLVRYSSFVRALVSRHVPTDRIAEVAQDVFISAYCTLSTFSGRGGFKHWLSRIAVRRCYDFWRERGRQRETPFSQLTDEHIKWLEGVSTSSLPEVGDREVARLEATEILDFALARLSPGDRSALTLVYLEGMPPREAADLLGWSHVLLRVRVHRAKSALRKIILELLEMRVGDEKRR